MRWLQNTDDSDQTQNVVNTLVLEYLLSVENSMDDNSCRSSQEFIENIQQQYDENNISIRVRMCVEQFKKTMRELDPNVDPDTYKKSVLNNIDGIRSILSEVQEDEFPLIFVEASFGKPEYISKITKWEDDLRKNIKDEDKKEIAAGKLLDYVKMLASLLAPPRLTSIISDSLNNDIRSIGSFMSEAISEIPLAEEPPTPLREQEELRQTLNILTPFSSEKKPSSRTNDSVPDIMPPGLDSTQTIICDSDEESQPSQLFLSKPSLRENPVTPLIRARRSTGSSNSVEISSSPGIVGMPNDEIGIFSDISDEQQPKKKIKIGNIKLSKDELQTTVKAIAKKERRFDVSFTFKNKSAWDFIEKRVYGDDVSILGDSMIEEDTREPAFSPQRWKRRSDGKAARYWTKDELKALWEGFKSFGTEWKTIHETYKDRFHMTRHPGSLGKKFNRTLRPLIVDDELDLDQIPDE